MSQQTVLRFDISLRGTFSNSSFFRKINKDDKGAVVKVSTMFGPFSMLLVEGSSEIEIFRHLSNHVFHSL